GLAGLLALDGPRVAREQAGRPEPGPVGLVGLHQRARDGEAERPGLPGLPAAVHVGLHVVAPERVGGGESLLDVLHERGAGEAVPQPPPVAVPLACAGLDGHAGDARLPAPGRLQAVLDGGRAHAFSRVAPTAKAFGCCAWCGCSAPAYTLSFVRSFCFDSEFFGSIPNTAFSITRSGWVARSLRAGVWLSWPM